MPQIFFAKGLDPGGLPAAPAFASVLPERKSTGQPGISLLSFPDINDVPQAYINSWQLASTPKSTQKPNGAKNG
jgi:hypothetical protein